MNAPAPAPRRDWFRLWDPDPKLHGCVRVTPGTAHDWNERGFGIFWTVNAFRDGVRRIDHLEAICAWAVDIDAGEKSAQRARLEAAPLIPTLVVETKRGYQAYWGAKGGQAAHWNAMVLHRLVPWFGADKNARDLARILRVPGFLHLKDPADPFATRVVHAHQVTYSERDIVGAFPVDPAILEAEQRRVHAEAQRELERAEHPAPATRAPARTTEFWERLLYLDCEEGLARISGSGMVNGELYTFRRNSSGTKNIIVNGKSSSCWVDKNGRIGSLAKGGPTLYQWLAWYGHKPKAIVDFLKREFPTLEAR